MRVVIVGFGHAGRQHAEAVEKIPRITVHSVLESAESVNVAPFSRAAGWSEVLGDSSVDAVALCVPPGDRAELAVAALRAGKGVLLEKPPCMSVAEMDRLAAVPGRVGVMLQHRFRLPASVIGRPMANAVGTLLVSRPRDAVKHYTGWRGDSERALGGITAHLGVHYLDLACQVLGEVEGVEIHDYRECAPGIDVRVSGLARFAGGSTLSFTIAADVPARAEQLVIAGDNRYLTIADGAVTLREGDRTDVVPAAPTSAMRTRVYEEFADGPDVCSLGRSRSVLAVLDEVRRAGAR